MYAMSEVAKYSGLRLIAVSGLLMGLSACGGGGSGSTGGTGGGALPTAPVTITSTNQSAVAGAAFDSQSSTPTGAQTSASAPAPATDSVSQKVGQVSHAAAQQMLAQNSAPQLPTGAVTTYACTISGTWTMEVTSSTSGTATYYNCSDIANETMNGTLSISNLVSSGTATPYDLSYDVLYNLTLTVPADVMTVTGDMHLAMSGCSTTCASTTISGRSLTFTSAVNGTLSRQNYTITTDASGAVTVLTYTFASTRIGGSATFNMVTPFVQRVGSLFPYSGVATITGANSTVLKITVLGDETAPATSQVQLELSTDGGASYGAPVFVTWASISNML